MSIPHVCTGIVAVAMLLVVPRTPALAACAGDCNGNGEVTVNELVSMVNIALETAPVSQCRNGDVSGDGTITVAEIVAAVTKALNGCTVDVSGTWVQSDAAIASSSCAEEVDARLQSDIAAGEFDCVYTLTQNGHRVSVRQDCRGDIVTATAAVDDAGVVTATSSEKETEDGCTITSNMAYSVDASVSPTTMHVTYDLRFSSKCGIANCGLVLQTMWTRTN